MSEKVLFQIESHGKVVDITLDNFGRYFDGWCEEASEAGRHFTGYCTWDFDLTKEEDVPEDKRGMWHLSGFADGDWGTEFSDYEFVSNEEIKQHKDKVKSEKDALVLEYADKIRYNLEDVCELLVEFASKY